MVETFGEQRTNRTVDQTAGQDFFFALFAFAFEETAGDFTCGISTLEVIDSQREEVLASFTSLLVVTATKTTVSPMDTLTAAAAGERFRRFPK